MLPAQPFFLMLARHPICALVRRAMANPFRRQCRIMAVPCGSHGSVLLPRDPDPHQMTRRVMPAQDTAQRQTTSNIQYSMSDVNISTAASCVPRVPPVLLPVRCPLKCLQTVVPHSIYAPYHSNCCCKYLKLCPCPPTPRWAANHTNKACPPSI